MYCGRCAESSSFTRRKSTLISLVCGKRMDAGVQRIIRTERRNGDHRQDQGDALKIHEPQPSPPSSPHPFQPRQPTGIACRTPPNPLSLPPFFSAPPDQHSMPRTCERPIYPAFLSGENTHHLIVHTCCTARARPYPVKAEEILPPCV